jgi:hypothetical protein
LINIILSWNIRSSADPGIRPRERAMQITGFDAASGNHLDDQAADHTGSARSA